MTSKRRESSTGLPYPAGDYASPPDTFSPSNSPPSSISSAMRLLSTTIPGLSLYASSGLGTLAGASYSITSPSSLSSSGMGAGMPLSPPAQPNFVSASATLNRTASPTPAPAKGRGGQGLPPPKSATGIRQMSVSPTPAAGARKGYTVALGGPITARLMRMSFLRTPRLLSMSPLPIPMQMRILKNHTWIHLLLLLY